MKNQNDKKNVPIGMSRWVDEWTEKSFCYYQIMYEMRVIINMTELFG